MQQSIYYIKFALQFADMQITELVNIQALIDEFQRRGINTACIYDGHVICFAHPVTYDLTNNQLVLVN